MLKRDGNDWHELLHLIVSDSMYSVNLCDICQLISRIDQTWSECFERNGGGCGGDCGGGGSEWSESGGSEASGHGCFPWTGVTPSLCAHALVHICTITQVYRTLVWPNLSADFHCTIAQCAMHSEEVDTSVTSSYLCWCSCAFSVCNNVNWNERTMKTQNTCDLLWL